MHESIPVAYLNGQWLPFPDLRLPVFDLGIMQGATLTERLRTVRHEPYLVEQHLDRLQHGLKLVGLTIPESPPELAKIIDELVERNRKLIATDGDVAVVLFVTAGIAAGDAQGFGPAESRPTVCLYTAPLAFASWATWHDRGVSLVIPQVQQLPAEVVPASIKHRSRLHWYLADRMARETQPGSMALLLDNHGCVTETSSGNLFVAQNGEVITPTERATLPGISQKVVLDLCTEMGIPSRRADLTPNDVTSANEAFLTSSTYCIVPVAALNGQPIGAAVPGPVTQRLLTAWSSRIGVDIARQARIMAGAS